MARHVVLALAVVGCVCVCVCVCVRKGAEGRGLGLTSKEEENKRRFNSARCHANLRVEGLPFRRERASSARGTATGKRDGARES